MMRHPPAPFQSYSGLGPRHIPVPDSRSLNYAPNEDFSRHRSSSCTRDDIQEHYGRRLFQRLDLDGDGVVTRPDFVAGLTTERVRAMEVTEVEANRLFDKIDTAQQGVFTEEQFMKALVTMRWLRSLIRVFAATEMGDFDVAPDYDYSRTTTENYCASGTHFVGEYADIRSTRDYSWHSNYTPERQLWQDIAINSCLGKTQPQARPWIIYTCGAMGVGKGHVLSWLSARGLFPMEYIVHIDPDFFKRIMPEWQGYLENNENFSGTACHKESGYLQEIAQEVAIRERQHVLVDGSLSNGEWFSELFDDIRHRYPHYRIGIFYITASEATVRARIAKRSLETGRSVPEEQVLRSLESPEHSLRMLAPKTDLVVRIENEDAIILKCVEDYSGNWVRGLGRLFSGVECESLKFPDSLGPLYLEITSLWGHPFVEHSACEESSLAGHRCSTDSLDSMASGLSASYPSSKATSAAISIPSSKTDGAPMFGTIISGSPGAHLLSCSLHTVGSGSPMITSPNKDPNSGAVIKSGLLDKEGAGRLGNWRKRYFVLRQGSLSYYPQDKTDASLPPKGEFELNYHTEVNLNLDNKIAKKHIFGALTRDQEKSPNAPNNIFSIKGARTDGSPYVLALSASDEESKMAWANAITAEIERLRRVENRRKGYYRNSFTKLGFSADTLVGSPNLRLLSAVMPDLSVNASPLSVWPGHDSDMLKKCVGAPEFTAKFRFLFPSFDFHKTNLPIAGIEDTDVFLLLSGGLAYYDRDDRVLGVMAISGHPSSSSIQFRPPELLHSSDAARLADGERWVPVCDPVYISGGARYFTFIAPYEELVTKRFPPYGCFAFLFREPHQPADPRDRYFEIFLDY